ncbi:MAG: flavin reductase family protein [Bacillota bacterium]|nr:flavin reductase family protein [Bacillota bacterium]
MKDIAYNKTAEQFLEQLPKGAFLTVQSDDRLNTMTIGWGSLGIAWRKPVLMVMVRYSRFTHELLENAADFTVSVPLDTAMKPALSTAGSKSGRDINKFETANLTAQPSKIVQSPVINECDLFYECKIIYQQSMDPAEMPSEIKETFYGDDDLHVMYFGEIVASYTKE